MGKSLTQLVIAAALLTGGLLFVCDVLSPDTPTPTAQLVAKSIANALVVTLPEIPFLGASESRRPERLFEPGAEQPRKSRDFILSFVCSFLL
jgi:hypothetical protein